MDTATPIGGVALLDGERELGRILLTRQRAHAATLPQSVARLLAEAGWGAVDLDLLAVTHGPGSFTGLRIAMAFAKGLHLAHGTPLVGLSTLMVLAAGQEDGMVVPLLPAGRGELYAGFYTLFGSEWPRSLWPDGRFTPQSLKERLAAHEPRFVGAGVPVAGVHGLAEAAPDPLVLARLALRHAQAPGGMAGGPSLQPLYLRLSEAEVNRERDLGGV